MKNDNILGFLKELVKFRQKEILQMQRARCAEKQLVTYSNRTNLLINEIQQLETNQAYIPAETEQDIEQFDLLTKELAELKKKYTSIVQLCADYKNQKTRLEKQLTEQTSTLNSSLLLEILNIVDDFERVLELLKKYESNSITNGINLVYANLLKVLSNNKCEKIDCKAGDSFDVNFHEAVASLPHKSSQSSSGTITQIMQSGWLLNGKLLRATKVVVQL